MGMLKYIADKLYSNDKEVLTEDSIESGTFANGGWVKYPDGTMIEWGRATTTTADSNNRVTFQNAFISNPSVVGNNTSGSNTILNVKILVALTTHFDFGMLYRETGSNDNIWNGNATMMYHAIGRWK